MQPLGCRVAHVARGRQTSPTLRNVVVLPVDHRRQQRQSVAAGRKLGRCCRAVSTGGRNTPYCLGAVLSSSRRVKKGPGRRPQSAKRQRFMELRERGWSVRGAAREVGVARTTGANWARGYKTYRNGKVVGFVPPLERLAVRQVSPRFLSQDERIEIADLRQAGLSVREIALKVGRAPSTISRELRRNASGRRGYRPFEAHRMATARRVRDHRRRVETNIELRELIAELLMQRWSPQQISRHLRRQFPDEPRMHLCHESIYQAVYQPGSVLLRLSKLAPYRRSPLRTGRDHRRAHQRVQRRRPRFEQPMLTIHQRPFQPEDRSEVGHWEGDLIIGKEQRSAIGTARRAQDPRGPPAAPSAARRRVPARGAEETDGRPAGRAAAVDHLGSRNRDGPTPDHHQVTRRAIYFCDSRSPWQRGSNENMNGLLRDYFPKGTDLSTHSPEHLLAVENELNSRPRRVLNDQAPAELFAALLASKSPSVLRR